MMYYSEYSEIADADVDAFVRTQEMGRLVTVSEAGTPQIGLYPFVYSGDSIEIHLHRADDQIAALERHARCVFEVDEVLATIPSYWLDPENAVMATAYHRTVVFECDASVSADAALLAKQQMEMLARYQPEGGYREVTADEVIYRGALNHIRAVSLRIVARKAKFKLAQNRRVDQRANVIAALRRRGRPNDARAAEALQWTIDRAQSA